MALNEALTEVLHHYCCPEVVEKFKVSPNDSKAKWLDAIKTVIDRVIGEQVNMVLLHKVQKRRTNKSEFNFYKSIDPLLVRVLKLLRCKQLFDLTQLKDLLAMWGKLQPRQVTLMNHYFTIANTRAIKTSEQPQWYSTNASVKKDGNVKTKYDVSQLKETCIKDMKLFEISKGKFIRGKLITPPFVMVGVNTYMEDRNGDFVKLALYNVIPNCKDDLRLAEMRFPVGTSVIICEPFYKIFADGCLGIRVDSPDEFSVVQHEETTSFDVIREKGKSMVKSGDYLGALELYMCSLTQFKEVELLLNNRSQTELKLDHHEDALLDAAAVLFLNHSNEKARMRYQNAKHNITHDNNSQLWEN